MQKVFSLFFLFLFCIEGISQDRTVGVLTYNTDKSQEGYNLIFPHGQSNVYLLNNCGEVVNIWEGDQDYVPGNAVYLTKEGTLIRCSRYFIPVFDSIWAGGGGQLVEEVSWDGELLWSFEQNDSLKRVHHDVEVLPSGNVLMISWEYKSFDESVEAGRDPNNINLGKLWPDYVLEYDPVIDSVVWEWHSWDHLIQDFDDSKANYGVVEDHPEKIDINYENNLGNADWHHMNSIAYNEDLDQIVLSVPHFDEFWIIDHSTTMEEAASSEGGNAGKGGDLLYRFGNPRTYRQGSEADQRLYFQHDVHWIRDFVNSDHPYYDKILLFNNRFAEDHSIVNVIDPPLLEDGFNYDWEQPEEYLLTIKHPVDSTKLYSTGLSSAQLLSNGNFLILSGRFGYAFEITPDNEIVWEYKVPLNSGEIARQGDVITINNNLTFAMKRYPLDFEGFVGQDLSSKGLLQIETDTANLCDRIVFVKDKGEGQYESQFTLSPNPVIDELQINNISNTPKYLIFNCSGKLVSQGEGKIVNVSNLESGLYFIKIDHYKPEKFIKF